MDRKGKEKSWDRDQKINGLRKAEKSFWRSEMKGLKAYLRPLRVMGEKKLRRNKL